MARQVHVWLGWGTRSKTRVVSSWFVFRECLAEAYGLEPPCYLQLHTSGGRHHSEHP
jgi:hypothetical protein